MAALALGAIMTAGAALAQQDVPLDLPSQPSAAAETVPQERFETGPQGQDEIVEQPRFVRAPGAGGIEVTPLAPPGETGEAAGADGQGTVLPAQGASVETLDQGTGMDGSREPLDRASIRQERFKSAPEDASRLALPAGPGVPIDAPPTELRHGVRLRELDKMTGQTETFELAAGETRQVDRLKIRLEACRSPEGNDTHGTIAFLKIWDVRQPDEEAFSGWMFAQSPSLSALDHPRYDLWVISCTTSAVATSSPSE